MIFSKKTARENTPKIDLVESYESWKCMFSHFFGGILEIDGNYALLGSIPFSESIELYSAPSSPDNRTNRIHLTTFSDDNGNAVLFVIRKQLFPQKSFLSTVN